MLSAALVASLLSPAARAEDVLNRIEQRITATFDLIIGNAASLAVPLARRALARRSVEEKHVEALSYRDPSSPGREAFAAVSPETAAPVTEGWSEGIEIARLPRPRPLREGEEQGSADPVPPAGPGAPLDLVAGAAAPAVAREIVQAQPARQPRAVVVRAESANHAESDFTGTEYAMAAAAPSAPDEPILTASTRPSAPELVASGACLSPQQVSDRDGDFRRNAAVLSGGGFCIGEEKFKERRRPWTIQTVKTDRPGPLWAVMHDDEDMSFDTAVAALARYGGTLVAFDTGGKRNQDGIDPNRNFSADGIGCRKLGNDAAPRFTAFFRSLISAEPIIALHNNYDGHVPTGGLGHASMRSAGRDMRAVAAADPQSPLASEYSLVLLVADADDSAKAERRARALSAKGINAMIEMVRDREGDCSLSNYALLTGHDDYLNVTVNHDEGDKQRKIVDVIMAGRNDTVAAQ